MSRYNEDTDIRTLDTPGFLLRIYRKTDTMASEFSKLQGQLTEKLPQLATRDEVKLMVIEKLEECRTSRNETLKSGKSRAKTAGLVSGMSAIIYLLVDKLVSALP